jgi:hypothetical protein
MHGVDITEIEGQVATGVDHPHPFCLRKTTHIRSVTLLVGLCVLPGPTCRVVAAGAVAPVVTPARQIPLALRAAALYRDRLLGLIERRTEDVDGLVNGHEGIMRYEQQMDG